MFKSSRMSYGSEYGLKTPRGIVLCMAIVPFWNRVQQGFLLLMGVCSCVERAELARGAFCLVWHLTADCESLPDLLWAMG